MSVAPADSGSATGPASGHPAPASAGRPSAAFERVRRAFFEAASATGETVERAYVVAGLPVLLRFAGPALLPAITPALAHLISDRLALAGLTVHLWDSASTGIPIPPPPATEEARESKTHAAASGRIYSAFQPEPQSLSLLAPDRSEAIYWVPDPRRLPIHERAAPLRWIFHWCLRDQGQQMAHAGAVGTRAGAVVLAGPSGSGKSTTALACLSRGLDYLGDDYVALAPGPDPSVHSLYNSAKLNADNLDAFPHLASFIENRAHMPAEKALMFLNGPYAEQLRHRLPARAILVPQVRGGAATRVVEVSPGEALRALAPSTIIQLVGAGGPAFQTIARFLKALPCYRLELGGPPMSAADTVSDLLARL